MDIFVAKNNSYAASALELTFQQHECVLMEKKTSSWCLAFAFASKRVSSSLRWSTQCVARFINMRIMLVNRIYDSYRKALSAKLFFKF